MTLAQQFANTPAVAYIGLSNYGGLEILDVNCEEIVACFNFGHGREMIRRHQIIYTSDGRGAYIRKAGHKYYMNEMMRV